MNAPGIEVLIALVQKPLALVAQLLFFLRQLQQVPQERVSARKQPLEEPARCRYVFLRQLVQQASNPASCRTT